MSNVPPEVVKDLAPTGALDILFLAIEPVRANEIAFTAPYVLIEGVYMVPKVSALETVADVDRGGVRIAG
jgi:polar amino acid transport system substrate-binding protein